ncbi:hypothetical protein BASA61_010093 [Batrachochytrium salamandrivorans]|nr:hypothetical protein BASA61_010093 [Batrachochytrium salamandrivorans]
MDLFSSIGAGAKFNKARFSQDFQVFKSTKAQAKLPDQQAEDVTPRIRFLQFPTKFLERKHSERGIGSKCENSSQRF